MSVLVHDSDNNHTHLGTFFIYLVLISLHIMLLIRCMTNIVICEIFISIYIEIDF